MLQPTDVLIQDLAFDTAPTGGKPALALQVRRLTATLADAWLEKMARLGLAAGAGRFPVAIAYVGSRFLPDGAELTVKAGEGLFNVSPTLRLEIAGEGPGLLRVKVAGISSPGLVPVEKMVAPALEKIIDQLCARPGVERHPTEPRAIRVAPAILLDRPGLALPGDAAWTVEGGPGLLTVRMGVQADWNGGTSSTK